MNRTGFVLVCVFLLAASPTRAQSALSGDWVVVASFDETPRRVTLTATGDTFKGTLYGSQFTGTQKGESIEFRIQDFLWQGKRTGDEIRGQILREGQVSAQWSARRLPPRQASKTRDVSPSTYSRVFTASLPPLARLNPGDTARTKTVDAGGNDENSKQVTRGGNPLTGPFYIEGALPGDVLVVKLNRVRTNRDWAFSGRVLVDTVLDADYLRNRTFDRPDNTWRIDAKNGTVALTNPTPRLANFSAPLRPFLGCIGVAPAAGASISTKESGPFGGNMEYSALREGATVYLPVFEEGAFLFLGDGHAAQGDGELAGDALETSLDVEFSVDILPSREQRLVRAENAEAIMSIGVAGSLDQAIRAATSDLARWLESEYKLTSAETALLLGVEMKYDIADMVPPQLGCVARLPKSVLNKIRKPK